MSISDAIQSKGELMKNMKIIENQRTAVNSVVTISGGIVRNIESSSIFLPRTRFKGDNIKWFDDAKLVKGGAE